MPWHGASRKRLLLDAFLPMCNFPVALESVRRESVPRQGLECMEGEAVLSRREWRANG
jgi:hypothetical protein